MSYKLICMDMDGTLLNDNKEIDGENIKAIREAINRGVIVTICTGRLFRFASMYAKILGIKAPIISANGSYISEVNTNKIIYKRPLGIENCKKIINILVKYNINPHFNSTDTIFTGVISHSSEGYMRLNQKLSDEEKFKIKVVKDWEEVFLKYNNEILKCIAIDDNLKIISEAKEEVSALQESVVESSFANNFEVMSRGVSKGKAVSIVAQYYNIDREEVICVGDNENDLSMIEYAGLGVAMGNSIDIIKERADFITSTNNENGISKVIKKFIL